MLLHKQEKKVLQLSIDQKQSFPCLITVTNEEAANLLVH